MNRITINAHKNPNALVLTVGTDKVLIAVGEQKFELDTESLWDLAKTAVLCTTRQSAKRRRAEAKAANWAGAMYVEEKENEQGQLL